jgi:octaprenyl-diphosphate synthase
MGAASGEPEYREPLARYGHALGMAFQIADDLLDYTGAETVTGKPSGQDLREHKVTIPLIAALREMDDTARRQVEEFFADPEPAEDGIREIIGLAATHGGIDYARRRAEDFGEQAAAALLALPDGQPTSALRDAVAYVIDRRR